ncbi:MAG TPA: hypothetical protein VKB31_09175 [Trueperaceae bacterium]|nr:hypothetical protein [Trueperaceae bacterium]
MNALVWLALAFAGIIAGGTVAVAVNDAVERWLARRPHTRPEGGGGRLHAAASERGYRRGSCRPGLVVERTTLRALQRSGMGPGTESRTRRGSGSRGATS